MQRRKGLGHYVNPIFGNTDKLLIGRTIHKCTKCKICVGLRLFRAPLRPLEYDVAGPSASGGFMVQRDTLGP